MNISKINETIIRIPTMAPITMPAIAPALRPVPFGIESTVILKENKQLLKQI